MTTFPNSPKLLKGGIVLIDPVTSAVRRIIALQYNPDSISRTFQVQGVGAESGDRSEGLRLKGPPNTLRYRRREGSLALLECLANDIAGWRARAVEFYPLLAWTQHLKYLRPNQGRTVDLRNNNALQRLGGAFELNFNYMERCEPAITGSFLHD